MYLPQLLGLVYLCPQNSSPGGEHHWGWSLQQLCKDDDQGSSTGSPQAGLRDVGSEFPQAQVGRGPTLRPAHLHTRDGEGGRQVREITDVSKQTLLLYV